jgi:hypothetical protein
MENLNTEITLYENGAIIKERKFPTDDYGQWHTKNSQNKKDCGENLERIPFRAICAGK